MQHRPLQRIVWSEGMMMSPQHMQQLDLYHESLLDERIGAALPHAWGVAELSFDSAALDAGQVLLRNFRGTFPQGAVFAFDLAHPEAPDARPVEGHFAATAPSLGVYLGLPTERPGGVALPGSTADTARARYIVETRATPDANDSANEAAVDYARRNLTILFGTEPRTDFDCLKIAELVRTEQGKLAFSEAFVPRLLRASGSSFVMESLRRVLAHAVTRQRAVAAERRQRDGSTVDYDATDVTRFLTLHSLCGAIPLLQLASQGGHVSPLQLYAWLASFAGQLMAFSAGDDPSELPPYVHDDPRQSFEPLFAKLTALLRTAVASRVITVRLDSREDGMHLGKLTNDALQKAGVRFVLSVQAPVAEAQALEVLPRVAKLGSWTDIARFVSSATPGIPLTAAPRPPREIPIRTGRCYFTLAGEHPYLRNALLERTLALHLPPPFEPKATVVELIAIPQD